MTTASPTPPPWVARVAELLAHQGKSRAWLAEEIGLSAGALTQVMLGIRPNHPAQLRHIAEALGVPERWLTMEKETPA